MKRMAFLAVVACLCGCALTGSGRAEFIITFAQNGANVDATGSGSLNIAALTFDHSDNGFPFVQGTFVIVQVGVPSGPLDDYTGFTGPTSIGPGGPFPANIGSGPIVGIQDVPSIAQFVVVPFGYISDTPIIMSSAIWANETIDGLGLTPGTYEWTWGSGATADDLKLVIPSPAPEPASLTLLGIGVAGLAGYGWRRRTA